MKDVKPVFLVTVEGNSTFSGLIKSFTNSKKKVN